MYAEEECLHGVDSGYVSMMSGGGGRGVGGVFCISIFSEQKSFFTPSPLPMDQITKKKPNLKCRLYLFNRVNRLEIQSVMLVFSTPLVN
jgi:hypothetical protein